MPLRTASLFYKFVPAKVGVLEVSGGNILSAEWQAAVSNWQSVNAAYRKAFL